MREELTQERLKELLHYDPDTGVFSWLPSRRGWSGKVAGCFRKKDGYLSIRVDGCLYLAHRLAFLYVTGSFPSLFVDHKNGIGSDNSWSNLREATHCQNLCNTGPHVDNISGYKGVSWFKPAQKYRAEIKANKVRYNLGYFDCPRQAAHAYNKAAIQLHGEFAVLNPI